MQCLLQRRQAARYCTGYPLGGNAMLHFWLHQPPWILAIVQEDVNSETYQSMLACCVRDACSSARSSRLARDVDNRSTLLLLHKWQDRLHQANRDSKVDSDHALPFVFVQRVSATPSIAYARAINKNIDPAVLLVASRYCLVNRPRLREVGLVERKCLVLVGKLLRNCAHIDAEDKGFALEE
jgi:hypothetical protein